MLLLLLACIDNGLSVAEDPVVTGDDTDAVEQGALSVGPEAVDRAVCESAGAEVTLTGEGPGPVEVLDVRVEGAGWTLDQDWSPRVLGPGEQATVALSTTGGSADLVIESDAVVNATQTVPLRGYADEAPEILWLEPVVDAIVDIGVPVVLRAQVSDAEDGPEGLEVFFSSSEMGPLGSSWSDASGIAVWDFPQAPSGFQTAGARAVDSCGNEASDGAEFCRQEGYATEELDISSWTFSGQAVWDSTESAVQLTGAGENQVGSAFSTAQTVSADNVDIRFDFYIGDGTGADGLSLTVIDTNRLTTYLGGTGCGIGYGGDASCTAGPALPGYSIEVDTYFNDGQDPTAEDHLMFTFDGDVDDPAVWAVLPEMEDTGWHTLEVSVVAPRVVVSVDGVTYIDQDIAGVTAFPAHVGFTAGTGGLTNRHLVRSLEVTEFICD